MTQLLTQFDNLPLAQIHHVRHHSSFVKMQQDEINEVLRELGAVAYDLWLPETHALPFIIHPNEKINGIVYGKYKHGGAEPSAGRGALVATDSRILLVDKKPLFLKCDELSYSVVSGVTYTKVGPGGTVTLHTRAGDIEIRTLNQHCAHRFVESIEAACFKDSGTKENHHDYSA